MCLFGIEARDENLADTVIDALIEKVNESGRYPTALADKLYAYMKSDDKLRKAVRRLVCMGRPR